MPLSLTACKCLSLRWASQAAKLCKVLQMIAQRSPREYLRIVRSQSGRQDSNLRPSAPKALGVIFKKTLRLQLQPRLTIDGGTSLRQLFAKSSKILQDVYRTQSPLQSPLHFKVNIFTHRHKLSILRNLYIRKDRCSHTHYILYSQKQINYLDKYFLKKK